MSRKRKPMAEINVVPYIDVMLVLLVIFMATAPLLTQGVTVDLPNAPSEPVADQDSDPLHRLHAGRRRHLCQSGPGKRR